MAIEVLYYVIFTRVLSLVLGSIIAYLAIRGYSRTKERSLKWLASGLGLVTIGTAIEGALFGVLEANLVHAIESTFNVLGFFSVIYAVKTS